MELDLIDIFTLKSNQERPELINPGKCAINNTVVLVDISIKVPFSAAFDGRAIAFILINIWNDAMIPKHVARRTRIKAATSIEQGMLIVQSKAAHVLKDLFAYSF